MRSWININKAGRRAAITIALLLVVFLAASGQSSNYFLRNAEASTVFAKTAAISNTKTQQADELIGKNETVYGLLDNDGNISSVEIVNHVFLKSNNLPSAKTVDYYDYGSYSELINLLDERQCSSTAAETDQIKQASQLTGIALSAYDDLQAISWGQLELDSWSDLYYQGTLKAERLPWQFGFAWELDGKKINAEDLKGKDGTVELLIKIRQGEDMPALYRDNFVLQVAVALPLAHVRSVEASRATSMITGRTQTLAWNVLPGQDIDIKVSFDATDFRMDPVQITGLLYSGDLGDLDQLVDGFIELHDGQVEISDGSLEIRDGLLEFNKGLGQIDDGLSQYIASKSELEKAFADYRYGLEKMQNELSQLADGSSYYHSGLNEFLAGGSEIQQGYEQLLLQLGQMKMSAEQKAELVAQLEQIEMGLAYDPTDITLYAQKEMIFSLLSLDEGIGAFEGGLVQLNAGLTQYLQGGALLSTEYEQIKSGLSAVPSGVGSLIEGIDGIDGGFKERELSLPLLRDGLREAIDEGQALPQALVDLSDGQKELADGLAEIKDSVDALINTDEPLLLSYAAPGLVEVDSIQFLIRTAGID